MNIKGTKTEKNLLKAFVGESQARNRYKLFAEKARKEGFELAAIYFDFAAGQEERHSIVFAEYLKEGGIEAPAASFPAIQVGSTSENLHFAAEGERQEGNLIYPDFANIAKEEGFTKIYVTFNMLSDIEKRHEERFRHYLNNDKEFETMRSEDKTTWSCQCCGYEQTGETMPESCAFCNQKKSMIKLK